MAEQPLFTYQDAVDHVKDYFDIASSDVTSRNHRACIRAVGEAYRDLPRMDRWSYYDRRMQIKTVAEQTSSTITFDLTGGTYERMVTLASGSWPADAKFYNILIDNERYKIEDYKTSSIITLNADSHPAADVAAGTSYTLFRANYPLPINVRRVSPLVEIGSSLYVYYLPPNRFVEHSVSRFSPQQPLRYTIRASGDYFGGHEVEFSPPPSTARTYDFMAEVEPRGFSTYKYTTGTAAITADTTTVTLTTGVVATSHVGDVIRLSTSSTAVTGLYGDPDGTDNPYTAQRVILSRNSSSAMTVDEAVTTSLSGVGYSISSPLDIATGDMCNCFLRLCEWYYMRLSRFDWKIEEKRHKEQEFQRALQLAMIADNKDRDMTGLPYGQTMYKLADWAVP